MKLNIPYLLALLIMPCVLTGQDEPSLMMDLRAYQKRSFSTERGFPLVLNITLYSTQEFSMEDIVETLTDQERNDTALIARIDSLYGRGFEYIFQVPWYEKLFFSVEDDQNISLFPHVLHPLPPERLEVRFNEPQFVDLGIDPEETRLWSPGTITVRAGLPLSAGSDTLWSDALHIAVGESVFERQDDYDNDGLYDLATYWLRRGDCRRAESAGKPLYDVAPENYAYVLLMANIRECAGDIHEALALYQRALQMSKNQPVQPSCPPVYLVQKIRELQDKILK